MLSAPCATSSNWMCESVALKGKGRNRLLGLLLLPSLLLLYSCSDKTMSLFFDIPPSEDKPASTSAQQTRATASRGQNTSTGTGTTVMLGGDAAARPAIESIFDWAEASAMLPKDDYDEVDWMEALRQGVIRPARGGGAGGAEAPRFPLDFHLKGPDEMFDAFFPHSAHTQLLTCNNCHGPIFKYRDNEITMDAMYDGQYCGTCHGKVAFSLDSCTRCHTGME